MSHDLSNDLVPLDDDLELIIEDEEREPTAEEIAAEIMDKTTQIARLTAEAHEIASEPIEGEDHGTALVPANVSAAAAKKRLAAVRAKVTRREMELQARRDEIRATQEEIRQLMYAQARAMEEALAPIQKQMERLNEGIWMVNLYLGRDEEIVVLHDGEPAAANEKVAIRQMVLAMDEESALDPEYDGIDATQIDAFDEWLQEDWAHVEQIAPETKCVVALRPRRVGKRYEDPWKQQAVDEANRQTYFLIRNGGKVFRTWTEFNAGDQLVPNGDEFTSYFFHVERGWHGEPDIRVPIQPGTRAWEEAEEKADAQKRHYMRVGLILQGLVDRTTVFHPLPDGGINFLDFEHNGRSWRFVLDAEMALSTGRQPFYEWLKERNAQLQAGMRIVGAFNASGFRNHDYDHGYRSSRVRPASAKKPESGVLHVIEEEEGDALVIRYERTEDVYDPKMWTEIEDRPGWGYRGGSRKPKKRASCLLYRDDTFILPFDLVTEEEMIEYLGARLDRHAYAAMFPLLKAAILAKRAERVEEAPFRTMLAGVLARDNGVEVAEAEADLDSLIEWYKLANKNHRPLVGDEESQAKAVRMIVAEHARRLKSKRADAGLVVEILKREPEALLIGRKRDGKYVVLTPEDERNVHVREIEFTPGSKRITSEKRWRLMPPTNRRVRWHVAYASERFEEWDFNANADEHLTGPEMEEFTATVLHESGEDVLAVGYDAKSREFHTWRLKSHAHVNDEHPLRDRPQEPEIEHVERTWIRQKGEAFLRDERRSFRGTSSYYRRPWDTRDTHPDKRFRSDAENRYAVLFEHAENVARYDAEMALFKAAEKKRSKMHDEVARWLKSIEAAWVRRREAEEYARFIEEYQDPELWEGHRKTLPKDTFAFPFAFYHRQTFGSGATALALLVEYAVEQGADLDGWGVADLAAAMPPPPEWLRARLGIEAGKPLPSDEIPPGVLSLTFSSLADGD